MKIARALLAVALLAAAMAGCGEGGGSSDSGLVGPTGEAGDQNTSDDPGGSGPDGREDSGENRQEGAPRSRPDDGGSGAGGPAPSDDASRRGSGELQALAGKAAYLKRANRLCARSKAEREREFETYMRRAVPRGGSLERGLEEIYVPGLEAQLAALRELPPPAGDEREVATVLATIASWIEIVRREGASGKAAVDQALAETNRVGSRYGLTECVSG